MLHSSDILADSEKEFFTNMKQLSEASVATGNPDYVLASVFDLC